MAARPRYSAARFPDRPRTRVRMLRPSSINPFESPWVFRELILISELCPNTRGMRGPFPYPRRFARERFRAGGSPSSRGPSATRPTVSPIPSVRSQGRAPGCSATRWGVCATFSSLLTVRLADHPWWSSNPTSHASPSHQTKYIRQWCEGRKATTKRSACPRAGRPCLQPLHRWEDCIINPNKSMRYS